MKNTGVCFAALYLTMLFSSCTKNNDATVTPASNGGNNTTSNGTNGSGTTGTTNSAQAKMGYTLKAANTTTGVAQKSTAANTIQWTAGFANPKLIKFEAKQNGTEIEFKSSAATQIDLFSPIAAVFGNFTLPAGTYNEVELKVQLDKNGSNPALQLTGVFTNSANAPVPVSFVVADFVEIKTEANNVTVDSSTFTAVTTLDLSAFTTGITQTMLQNAQLINGTIVISASSNKDIYQAILNNLTSKHHHCEVEHHK